MIRTSNFTYFLSAAHALYFANYDSYDIGVFTNRLISTDLLGVELIRIKIRPLITLQSNMPLRRFSGY